jgi:pyruvate/2-oxoglutarate dehydrogenase complex dihydrolipoamide acyltransferase (E2) component
MMELRAAISARAAGLSVEDSLRAAREHVAKVKSTLARLEDGEAAREAKPASPAPSRNPPAPAPSRNPPAPAPRARQM